MPKNSSVYAPIAYANKRYKFTMGDGMTYVGVFREMSDTSRGVRWIFVFNSPDAKPVMIDPKLHPCTLTTEPVSDHGPITDDKPTGSIGSKAVASPPEGTYPPA